MKNKWKTIKNVLSIIALFALMIGAGIALAAVYAADTQAAVVVAKPSETVGISRVDDPEPDPAFNLTEEGIKMLSRLVWLESCGCSPECQRHIAEVVLNRLDLGLWGNTITDVMFSPGQFPPVNFLYTVPADDPIYLSIIDIVKDVVQNGVSIPKRVIFYCENGYFGWARAEFDMENCFFSSSWYFQDVGD